MDQSSDDQTGVLLQMRFIPISFLLFFATPRLHIDDGEAIRVRWGNRFFPLEPGQHTLRCYLPYFSYQEMGDSSVTVDVGPGQVVRAKWRGRRSLTPGRWTVEPEA